MSSRRYADPQRHPQQWFRQVLADAQRIEARGMSVPEIKQLTGLAGRLKSVMDALLVGCAAEVAASGTAASPQKVLQDFTQMSKRDANRITRTAQGLQELPNVKKRLDSGEITLGHAGVLVDTARDTGAEAVDGNAELLDRASAAPEDLFATEAERFAHEVAEDRGEELLNTQRRRRKASLWKDQSTGMGRLSAELDPVNYGLVAQALQKHAQALWREDRSGAAASSDAGRSDQQRMADALVERLTGLDALTHAPLDAGHTNGHTGSAAGNSGSSGRSGPAARGAQPPQLVIVADIGVIDGTDPAGRCEIPGTGPVPPSILGRLSPDTKLAGMIFAGDGRPLWLGRSRRRVNTHQYLAVAVRDRGCVRCGAPMHNCHVHHIRPWEHDGPTDIDNLQALCAQHHRQHHGPHQPEKQRDGRHGHERDRRSGGRGGRAGDQRPPPAGTEPDHDNADPLNGRLLL